MNYEYFYDAKHGVVFRGKNPSDITHNVQILDRYGDWIDLIDFTNNPKLAARIKKERAINA